MASVNLDWQANQKRLRLNRQARERRAAKRKAGLCVDCGQPTQDKKARCPACAAKNQEIRRYYLQIGYCPVCHKYPIMGREKECPECVARRIVNNRRSYERALAEGKDWADPRHGTERAKKRYARLKEAGRCVRCGKLKPMPGRTMCGICAEKRAAEQREYRLRKKECKE